MCICEACLYNLSSGLYVYYKHGCMVVVNMAYVRDHTTIMLGLPGLYVCLPSLIKAGIKLECLSAMNLTDYCKAHEGD